MSESPDPNTIPTTDKREAARLRRKVRAELKTSGFVTENGQLQRQETLTKQAIRDLHARQRKALLERSRPFIDRWEDKIIGEFANGHEVNPRKIRPVVERVDGDGFDAALFRFATLHWSIPVSVGYGRRTRFLVRDRSNEKLIGVFALGDPVYNLRSRDAEIEWGVEQRNARLYNVLDAFVLGALPPYRELLGGKL
ncbi:MAG TPA: Druantia anti-phage system protein DruA, partial [Thermoanaerobaculia bacterium]|nr:Druantia anti-phage system protein DruA [Thermoanaerobaculia bacterium]